MDPVQQIKLGMELFRAGRTRELTECIRKLKASDPVAGAVLEVSVLAFRFQSPEAIRKGTRLLSAVAGRPELAGPLFNSLGTAYSIMGEIETSENYFLRYLEASEAIGDEEGVFRARMNLFHSKFCRGEYDSLYREIKEALRRGTLLDDYYARYLLALLEVIRGEPERVLRTLDSIKHPPDKRFYYFGSLEIRGLAMRLMGRFDEAMDSYRKSVEGMVSLGTAYAAFPCAKALELSRLSGLPSPPSDLVKVCIGLANKGSWGERAAAVAISAFLAADDGESARLLLEAAEGYRRAYHLFEAFTSGLTAAHIAWRSDNPIFLKALRFLAPLAPIYRGFGKDPLLGGFLADVYPLLTRDSKNTEEHSIRAYLIGDMRVLVEGKEVAFRTWRRKKAVKALVYLLLSPKHRLPKDHLFYLLWPKRRYDEKSREGLYAAIYTIRKNIGKPDLLTARYDFYQLEDVWTDLDELESLVRRAEATNEPSEKEELLRRARELAKDELLPEIIDDRYVEEYRQYYNRLRERLTGYG